MYVCMCVCMNNLPPLKLSFSRQKFQLENLSLLLFKLERHILFIRLANCESELTRSQRVHRRPALHPPSLRAIDF